MTTFTAVLVGILIGIIISRLRWQVPRYTGPQLHDGPYELDWAASGRRSGVVWRLRVHGTVTPEFMAQQAAAGQHRHSAFVCTIMPGTHHVDECWCGATRYGVFGRWETKELQP